MTRRAGEFSETLEDDGTPSCRNPMGTGAPIESQTQSDIIEKIEDVLKLLFYPKVSKRSGEDQDGPVIDAGDARADKNATCHHDPAISYSSPLNLKGGTTKRGRLGSDPPDDGRRKKRLPNIPSARVANGKDRLLWPCPFIVCGLSCDLHFAGKRVSDVRQHIMRKHLRKPFCPNCGITFENNSEREEHVRQQNCQTADILPNPLSTITQEQWDTIRERGSDRTNQKVRHETERWYEIWDISFPGVERPPPALLQVVDGNVAHMRSMISIYLDSPAIQEIMDELPVEIRGSGGTRREATLRTITNVLHSFCNFAGNGGISQRHIELQETSIAELPSTSSPDHFNEYRIDAPDSIDSMSPWDLTSSSHDMLEPTWILPEPTYDPEQAWLDLGIINFPSNATEEE